MDFIWATDEASLCQLLLYLVLASFCCQVLKGHTDNAEFALNLGRTAPYVISGGRAFYWCDPLDDRICLCLMSWLLFFIWNHHIGEGSTGLAIAAVGLSEFNVTDDDLYRFKLFWKYYRTRLECLSAGRDQCVVLWSIEDHITSMQTPRSGTPSGGGSKQSGTAGCIADATHLYPRGIFKGHTNTVEDVQFRPSRWIKFLTFHTHVNVYILMSKN